ncbi:MAG: MerR family transcriptional regulator [Rhodanobacter sp.]
MSKPLTSTKYLRIGQLAEQTGLSAKALRLYEARGLLLPDTHSASGYRLYGVAALARLTEICVLKRAGFTLAEVGALLQRRSSAVALVEARILALRSEVHSKTFALAALEHAWSQLDSSSPPTIEPLLENIRMSDSLDVSFSDEELAEFKRRGELLRGHFTDEDREQLRQRAERFGTKNMQRYDRQWIDLITSVRAAMEAGKPADDPAVLEMARRWHGLVTDFTGGNADMARKLKNAYDSEPQVMAAQGMDPPMFSYIGQAMLKAGLTLQS